MRRPTLRRFALITTEATGFLVMLGIYTAATGSGLACSQQWPLCDGGVLPNSLPSLIEWLHRFDAMLTGFLILGLAFWTWRASVERRTKLTATAALFLLPLQISIGAITVTLNGALPSGYSVPTHAAHLLTALAIFTSLVLTTLYTHEGHFDSAPTRRARTALLATLVLLPVNAVFGRATPLLDYLPWAQALFVGTALLAFAALVAALVWLHEAGASRARVPTVGAAASVFVVMLLGRDLVLYTYTVHLVNWLCYAAAAVFVAVALVRLRNVEAATPDQRFSLTD